MKGHMEDGKFHPHTQHQKGVRKSRDQSKKFVGIKIARDERARQQLKDAPESIKICSTCDRSFDISKQKGNDFFALPQCSNCKRKGVPPLGERKARDEEAITGKNKGNIIFDSKIGKYTLNGIPIHKGQTSMKEKEQLKFLESDNRKLHQIAVETQNKIDWRNMNRELSEIEEKMNALDQKELDGKISSKRYLVLHDQLEKQFTFVRWTKFGHLK